MQQTPDKDRPESHVPDLGKAAPVGSPYTNEEWKVLVETPVKICRAIMAVSPAGAIGMTKEIAAMRNSFKETLQATTNPTLQNLNQHLKDQEKVENLWQAAGNVFRDRWDAANVRQTAIAACQQVVTLLKKVPTQDALAYKEFLYTTARRVAEATKEGGFIGIGANKSPISEAEQSLLNDVSKTLELPRA